MSLVSRPSPSTVTKSTTRRNSRPAMRGVPRARLAISRVPSGSAAMQSAAAMTEPDATRRPAPGPLGWIALGAVTLLALILLVQLAIGTTDAIYSTTMLVLQLVALGVVVAAVATARGRQIGVIALAVAGKLGELGVAKK